MSMAAVQQQLLTSSHGDPIYIGPYLSRLSQALAASMTDDSRPISLEVQTEGGGTASSAEAVSIGLIVTELMMNAFKHAFVGNQAAGLLVVAYEAAETSWRLRVSDNGLEPRRANWIRIGHVQDWAPSSSRHSPSSLTLVWALREPDAARRCRLLMERQIALGL